MIADLANNLAGLLPQLHFCAENHRMMVGAETRARIGMTSTVAMTRARQKQRLVGRLPNDEALQVRREGSSGTQILVASGQ